MQATGASPPHAIKGHQVMETATLLAEALQAAILQDLWQLDVPLTDAVAQVVLLVVTQVTATARDLIAQPVAMNTCGRSAH